MTRAGLLLVAVLGLCASPCEAQVNKAIARSLKSGPRPGINSLLGSSVFSYTSFNKPAGTALNTITPDSGGGGTLAAQNSATAPTNQALTDGVGGAYSQDPNDVYNVGPTAPAADYWTEAFVKQTTVNSSSAVAVEVRAAPDSNSAYYCRFTNGVLSLTKVVFGTTYSVTGTTYSASWAANSFHLLRITASGSSLTCSTEGVARITATDTSITAAGRAGLRLDNSGTADTASTGLHILTITAGR